MTNKLIMLLSVFINMAAFGHLAIAQSPPQDLVTQIGNMNNLTSKQQLILAQTVQEQQADIRRALIDQLKSNNPTTQYYAAALLGHYPDLNVVNALNHVITLKDPIFANRWRIAFGWVDEYPAVQALASIGNISIPTLESNLATSDDLTVRLLSLRAIETIEGSTIVAKAELSRAILAEKDSTQKARLEMALHLVDSQAGLSFSNLDNSVNYGTSRSLRGNVPLIESSDSMQPPVNVLSMSAELFEAWVNVDLDRYHHEVDYQPSIPEKAVVSRLKAQEFVTDETELAVIDSWTSTDRIIISKHYADSFRVISEFEDYTYGRPALAAALKLRKADLEVAINDRLGAVDDYKISSEAYTNLANILNQQRMSGLLNMGELYLKMEDLNSASSCFGTIWDSNQPDRSDGLAIQDELFLRAGFGLIECCRGNLRKLRSIKYIYYGAYDEGFKSELDEAIAEATPPPPRQSSLK